MFFRKWLSFSGKSSRPVARRRNRRGGSFAQQAMCSGLGVETLESRQLLSATVLGTSALATPPFVIKGQVAAPLPPAVTPITPAVTPGLAPIDPAPTEPAQTQAADGVNQIGFNGVVGTAGGQTSAITPLVTSGVAPTEPAQAQAADGVNQIGFNGVATTASGQTSAITPAVTPAVTPTEPALQAADGVNQIGSNGVVGTGDGQTGSIEPAVSAGVTPTAPALQAADGVNQIGFDGVVSTGDGQTGSIEPAVTPGVTPSVANLAGFGVNSPPSASAPATGSLNENSSLSFSTADSNAISITDAAAGTNADSLTLSVSEGTLTLASTTGLSFTAGANGSASFTVSGTVTDLDSALDGLVYQATTLYSGADSLTASVSDPTDSLSASTSVSITVALVSPPASSVPESAPAISAPGGGSLNENDSLTFSSGNSNEISITDAAAGSNADLLTLSASQGTLALASSNGLSFTSGANGSSSFTVSGTATDLNAALNGLVYQPTSLYSGADALSVSVTDPGDTLSASASVALTVATLSAPASPAASSIPASAPAISVSASPSLTGDGSLAFSGGSGSAVSFTDSAAGTDSDSDSLAQSVSQGTTALGSGTGLSLTNGSATFTASSPVASVNSAVTYPADALSSSTNASSLTVNALAASPITATGTASGTSTGTGNISPLFASSNSSAMSPIDVAAGSNSDSLSLSVSHGRLGPTTGLSFTTGTNGSPSSAGTGTIANLNAALNGLTHKLGAAHVGSDSLSLSDSDRGDGLSGGTTVVFTGTALSASAIVAPRSGTLDQNGSLVLSTSNGNAASYKGAAAGGGSNSLTLSDAHETNILASATGLSFTTGLNGPDSFTVTGSAADLNALNGLTHKLSTTQVESDSISLADLDQGDSLSAAATAVFTVTTLSAPAIVAPPSGTLDQNRSLVFATINGNAISIQGVAAGSGTNSLTLSVAHGTITLASTAGLNFTTGINGSGSFTVTGTVANLNAALSGMVYTPTTNFSGSDSLAMKVSYPNGHALTNVALRVNLIAPSLTSPTTGTVPQNETLTFYKRAIKIADVNASTDMEQVVLLATRGKLKLGSTNGITFVSGANNSPSMTISGTLTSLNAGLNGLMFTPPADFYGSGTIRLKYTDAKNGLSVSTNITVQIGTIHASFGPPIQTASEQSTGVSPALQSTSSTIAGTVTSPDLSGTLPADDLARWDRFMEAMGLLNRS
jgi:large repetitive protein